MKILKYSLLTLLAALTLSCNDWLNSNPYTERTQEEMFSSEIGFKDALTGCYIGMMDNTAYGGALTMNTLEYMAWSYTTTEGTGGYFLSRQNWSGYGLKESVAALHLKLYNIIASCNSILDCIDERKDVFTTPGLRELIKGEALAIRAYCHFDILRLWGPVPTLANDAEIVLPYVTTLSFKATPFSSYGDFYQHVIDDLTDAADLLADVDPVIANVQTDDNYFSNRQFRMNYYAVKGLMARAYIWGDNRPEALECALEVINAVNVSSTAATKPKQYTLGNSTVLAAKDLTFSPEHLFAIYKFDLSTLYQSYYASGSMHRGEDKNTINDDLYANGEYKSNTDIRSPALTYWWSQIKTTSGINRFVSNKYSTEAVPANRMPLIRLAEMYLIAAEAHANENFADGLPYFETYYNSRYSMSMQMMQQYFNVMKITSRASLIDHIKKQYRKEFYAEGVIWYMYKRFNTPREDILWADDPYYVPNYVLPFPS